MSWAEVYAIASKSEMMRTNCSNSDRLTAMAAMVQVPLVGLAVAVLVIMVVAVAEALITDHQI